MKENVIDVLMFLFENYMFDEPEQDPDRESLETTLLEAGFTYEEIHKAFDWLDELGELRNQPDMAQSHGSMPVRLFTDYEQQRMDTDCMGFLIFLEQAGVIDATRRELIIDRVMAFDAEQEMDLEDLKWIILLVLFTQPGQEANYAWMENHLFDGAVEAIH